MPIDCRTVFFALALSSVMAVHGGEPVTGAAVPVRAAEGNVESGDLIRGGLKLEADGDMPSALMSFKRAAEKGSPEGAFLAASYLLSGRLSMKEGSAAVPENLAEGIHFLDAAAHAGHMEAMRVLGACFAKGRGVPQDRIEACKWWRLAADRGDDSAKAYLDHLEEQISVPDRSDAKIRASKFVPRALLVEAQPQLRVRLNGISGTASRRFALINNQPFSVGEQKRLVLGASTNLLVRCVAITGSSVQIQENDSKDLVTLTFGLQ